MPIRPDRPDSPRASDIEYETFLDGRFRVNRRLGRGAQGTVYAAYDSVRKTEVALKVLSGARPNVLYRFKKEFRELAEVVHPRLATLFEFFGKEGEWCFSMELVDGVDWLGFVAVDDSAEATTWATASEGSERATATVPGTPSLVTSPSSARMGSIPPVSGVTPALPKLPRPMRADEGRLRAALRGLVEGVCAMHSAGKLHLDLKPSNVLVAPGSGVRILDFGLTVSAHEVAETGGGSAAGTPAYMAPEQAARGVLSPASDWYAVGTMLYHAMTGSLPFSGDSALLLAAKQGYAPVAVQRLVDAPEDLADLAMRLLKTDPADRPSADEIRAVAGVASDRRSLLPAARGQLFVGRDDEQRALAERMSAACAGGLHTLVVQGPSGIGKSTLVEHYLDQVSATGSTWLLRGRCYEQEYLPYRGFDGVMDQLSRSLGTLPATELESLIPPGFGALSALFPVLRRAAIREEEAVPVRRADPRETRRAGVVALRELLRRMGAARPVVVYIDDFQWADADAVSLLTDLVAQPDPPSMLIVLTARDDELGERRDLTAALSQVSTSADSYHDLIVRPLSEAAMLELASKAITAGGDRDVERLIQDSGGSPFLLTELIRGTQEGGASSLDELLLRRVEALPTPAKHLVRVLALAGRPVPREVALTAAGDSGDPLATVAALRAERLIRVRSSGGVERLECYHDRVRESVADAADADTQIHVHSSLADAFIGAQGDAEHIVFHLLQSKRTEFIFPHALRAAENAASISAFDRAAEFFGIAETYRPAASTVPLWSVQQQRAEALSHAGRPIDAAQMLLTSADAHPHPRPLRIEAAGLLLSSGQIRRGKEVAQRVLDDFGVLIPASQIRAVFQFVWFDLRVRMRRFAIAPFTSQSKSSVAGELVDACTAFAAGFNVAIPAQSSAFFARAAFLALRLGDPGRAAIALSGHTCNFAAFFPEPASKMVPICRELAERSDELMARVYADGTDMFVSYFQGRFPEALVAAERAIERLGASPRRHPFEEQRVHLIECFARIFVGDLKGLRTRVHEQLRDMASRGDDFSAALVRTGVRWAIHLADDRPERVLDDLASLDGIERSSDDYLTWYETIAYTYRALYERRADEALLVLDERESDLRRSGVTRIPLGAALFFSLRASVLMTAADEEPDRRDQLLRRAQLDIRRLFRVKHRYAYLVRDAAKAAFLLHTGRDAQAMPLLCAASERLLQEGLHPSGEAIRWLIGRMQGGEEGAAMCAAADAWHRGMDVREPARFMGAFMAFPKRVLRDDFVHPPGRAAPAIERG